MNKDISIMIVDDNEPMRLVIKAMLEEEGYKNFVEAEDGVSAFMILQNQKTDLIISDWNMLEMTGIELLKKVRADKEIAPTPFILVSGEGLDISKDQAYKCGANDFIAKPFRQDELITSITRVMEQTT